MAQEFVIKSESLENKINQLLPSQGGFQAGVDLSASTMIMPIVDLTESAEGSALRQDLQTAFSTNVSSAEVENTTTELQNTTGFFRVYGTVYGFTDGTARSAKIQLNRSSNSEKFPLYIKSCPVNTSNLVISGSFDFIVTIGAGFTLEATSSSTNLIISAASYQICDINGNLTNPSGYTGS
jgi:hypothetical protein